MPMPPADPAPAPDSHEPAGRVDVPGAAPEWAVEMAFAHTFPADYNAYGYAEARRVWSHLEGTADWRRLDALARLLATLRERTLREAAGVCHRIGDVRSDDMKASTPEWVEVNRHQARGAYACYRGVCSLIAQPPKPERSDGSEAEGREEAT